MLLAAKDALEFSSGLTFQQFTRDRLHQNAIFKSMGVYLKMSSKHVQRYIDEYVGRHNARSLSTMTQIEITFKGMAGKRLRYKELTS